MVMLVGGSVVKEEARIDDDWLAGAAGTMGTASARSRGAAAAPVESDSSLINSCVLPTFDRQ
jgi:hypothetical protein